MGRKISPHGPERRYSTACRRGGFAWRLPKVGRLLIKGWCMTSRRWLITLVACLAIFAVLGGFKFLQIRAAIEFGKSFPEASESVEAVVVDSLLSSSYVTTIGEIVSPQSVELRNELEGRITAVNLDRKSVV